MLALILAAILLSNPALPRAQARAYAAIVEREARRVKVDPLLVVALVHSESRWRAGAVNHLGCVGLGQVCPRWVPGARGLALEDPAVNLRIVADGIVANRAMCRARTGRGAPRYWLASLGGFNRAGVLCGQRRAGKRWVPIPVPAGVRRILAWRRGIDRAGGKGR